MTEFVKPIFMESDMQNTDVNDRKTKDLQSFARMLMPLAKKILGAKGFVETDVVTQWTEIAGEELASFSRPLRIDFKKNEKNNGILWVETMSGAYALELQHREKFILSKVNSYFGYAAVNRLKILQNPDVSFDGGAVCPQECERVQKTLVSEDEENYIRKMSEGIQNSKLQEKLFLLGQSIVSHNKNEEDKK